MDPDQAQEIAERDQFWASLRALRQFVEARSGFTGFVERDEGEGSAMFGRQAAAVVAPGERQLESVVGLSVDGGDTGLIGVIRAERLVVGRRHGCGRPEKSERQGEEPAGFEHRTRRSPSRCESKRQLSHRVPPP